MKKLLLIPFILMSLISSPSWGMTVESLYKMCKPFQSKGFVFETNEDVVCASYTLGVVETLLWQCLFSDVEGFESIYPAKTCMQTQWILIKS